MAQLRLLNNIQYQISNAPQDLNMNGHNILDAGIINYSALNPPVGGGGGNFDNPSGTTLVFDAGIVGGVAINFNGNALENMGALSAVGAGNIILNSNLVSTGANFQTSSGNFTASTGGFSTGTGDITTTSGMVIAPTLKFSGNDSEQTTAYLNLDVQTITADLQAGADHTFLWQSGTSNHNVNIDLNVGLPATSGHVLSATTGGELSWIAMDGTGVDSVVGSTYISVNDADAKNPVVSLALPTPVSANGLVLASSTAGLLSWESVVATPSNAFYVNENVNMLEDVLPLMSNGDIVYISSGSFTSGADLTINKTNIGIIAPNVHPSITEVNYNLVYYTGTQLRTANLQFDCGVVVSSSNTRFDDCDFQNGLTLTSAGTYLTLNNCEFTGTGKTLTINAGSSAPILFTNVNFDGITIVLNNLSPLLVFFNNCAGFASFPSTAKATFIGLNVLQTLVSKVNTTSVIFGGDGTTQTTAYTGQNGEVASVVGSTYISVDNADAKNPVVSLALPTPVAENGYVLSSSTAGVLSWVAQSGGGGGNFSTPSDAELVFNAGIVGGVAIDCGTMNIANVNTISGYIGGDNIVAILSCDNNDGNSAKIVISNPSTGTSGGIINFALGTESYMAFTNSEAGITQTFSDDTSQNTAYQNLDVQTITPIVLTGASASFLSASAPSTHVVDIGLNVALPTIADQVLSSTTEGVLSWVAQSGGGGGTMNNPSTEALDMAGFNIANATTIQGKQITLYGDPCNVLYLSCDDASTSTITNISIINDTADNTGSLINFNTLLGTISIIQDNAMPQFKFKDETQQSTAYQNLDVQTITPVVLPTASTSFLSASTPSTHVVDIDLNVGLPATSGHVLSSTTAGVLSWVEQSGGGTMDNPSTADLDMAEFNIANVNTISGYDSVINGITYQQIALSCDTDGSRYANIKIKCPFEIEDPNPTITFNMLRSKMVFSCDANDEIVQTFSDNTTQNTAYQNPMATGLDMAGFNIANATTIQGKQITLNNDACNVLTLNCDDASTSTIMNISIINDTADNSSSFIYFNTLYGTISIIQENDMPQIRFNDETQQSTAYQNLDVQTITPIVLTGASTSFLSASAPSTHVVDIDLNVGLPATSGHVLSSTTAGVLSWVAQSGGGTMNNPSTADLDMGGFNISNVLTISSPEGNDLLINDDLSFINGGSSITFTGTENLIDVGQSGTIKGFTQLGFIDEATQVYTYQSTAYGNLDVQTITPVLLTNASATFLTASAPSTHVVDIDLNVGLPAVANQILSSTTAGVLSWVPQDMNNPSTADLDMGAYSISNIGHLLPEYIDGVDSLTAPKEIAITSFTNIQATQTQHPTTFSTTQVITSLDGARVYTFYMDTNLTPPTCTSFQRYDTQTKILGNIISFTGYINYKFPPTYICPQIITYDGIEWVAIITNDDGEVGGHGGVQLLSVFNSNLMSAYTQVSAGAITANSMCILSKFGFTYAPNIVDSMDWTITFFDEGLNTLNPVNMAWWQYGVAPPTNPDIPVPLIVSGNQYSVQWNNTSDNLVYLGINSLNFFNQLYNYQDQTTSFNTTLTFQYNAQDTTSPEIFYNGIYMLTWVSTSGTPLVLGLGLLQDPPTATNNIINSALIIPTAPSSWNGGDAIFNIVLLYPSGNLQTGVSPYNFDNHNGYLSINPDVATFSAPHGNSMVCSDCYSTSLNDPMAMQNGLTTGHLYILAPALGIGSVCYCSGIGGKIVNIIKAYETGNISQGGFSAPDMDYSISFYPPSKMLYSAGYGANNEASLTALTASDTYSGILLAEQAIFSRSIQIPADPSIPLGGGASTTNCGKFQLDTANGVGAKIFNHLITPNSIILLTKYGATNAYVVYVSVMDYGVAEIASSEPTLDGDVVMFMICNS